MSRACLDVLIGIIEEMREELKNHRPYSALPTHQMASDRACRMTLDEVLERFSNAMDELDPTKTPGQAGDE